MALRVSLWRQLLIGLFGLYLFVYPFGITLIALDRVPVWGTWMGGALLILQGAIMGIWLAIVYGRWGVLGALAIMVLAWAVEHIGATTGFPFGAYTYTDVLQPKVLGVVPLAIPFAWLLIVTSAMGAVELLMDRDRGQANSEQRISLTRLLMAASFALLLDVTIEPFAVHINNYWTWTESGSGGYYGIPASNFVAWWVTSLLLSFVLLWTRRAALRRREPALGVRFMSWLPLTLYLTNLTMFVVVNLARGQAVAAQIGGLILLVIAGYWLWPRLIRRRRVEQKSGV
jgi:putative membrane protein